MTTTTKLAGAICALLMLVALLLTATTRVSAELPSAVTNTTIAMGVQELKNTAAESSWNKSALDVGTGPGSAPEMSGKIRNKTEGVLNDVTFVIENKGSGTGPAPTPDGVTVTNPLGGSATASFSGGKATVTFGDGSGSTPGPLADGNTWDFDIEITSAGSSPPSKFTVTINGSVEDKPKGSSVHAEFFGWFEFNSSTTGITRNLSETWHDRIAVPVRNKDTTDILESFSGEMTLPSGITISSAHLQDPDNEFNAVSGTSISTTNTTFSITGFELDAGDDYEIIVVFSGEPQGETELELNATFQEE